MLYSNPERHVPFRILTILLVFSVVVGACQPMAVPAIETLGTGETPVAETELGMVEIPSLGIFMAPLDAGFQQYYFSNDQLAAFNIYPDAYTEIIATHQGFGAIAYQRGSEGLIPAGLIFPEGMFKLTLTDGQTTWSDFIGQQLVGPNGEEIPGQALSTLQQIGPFLTQRASDATTTAQSPLFETPVPTGLPEGEEVGRKELCGVDMVRYYARQLLQDMIIALAHQVIMSDPSASIFEIMERPLATDRDKLAAETLKDNQFMKNMGCRDAETRQGLFKKYFELLDDFFVRKYGSPQQLGRFAQEFASFDEPTYAVLERLITLLNNEWLWLP